MSRTLPTLDELDRAAGHAVDTMRDTCVLLTRSTTQDPATGMPVERYADGVETVCGFGTKQRREGYGSTQVVTTIIALRLPLAIAATDILSRVRIITRRGRAIPIPETYEITSAVRGSIQWNLELRRIGEALEG